MKIAVTGKAGQVASSLGERGMMAGHEVITLGRPELDLANPASVLNVITSAAPEVIVSAAAYTAVDKAEGESAEAHTVNSAGAEAVAKAAKALGVPLIHISTDYVFDGRLDRAYTERDATGPTGVYGASKLAGEKAVLAVYPENSAILRVAWVYSPFGSNFVKTMLRIANDRDEITVVADQIGNPTSALDIADGILKVAQNLITSPNPSLRGVFHMTAEGEATWAEFAEAVFSASLASSGPSAMVKPITTSEYPTPAARPANSRLNCEQIALYHGVNLPAWQVSVKAVVGRLNLDAN